MSEWIDYNIAVECDELQHNVKINKQHDLLREDFIKRKLKCEFIRFKPYEKDFNIFELIGKIHSKMIECIKTDTNEKQDKIETKKYFIKSAATSIKSKYMMRDKSDNKYHIEGKIYEKIRGTREEVWCGAAYQTTGELKKRDLEMNRYGKIVSKVKLIRATMDNNFIKYRGTKFPLWPLLFGQGVKGDSMSPHHKWDQIQIKNNKRCKYFLLFIFLIYYELWIMNYLSISRHLKEMKSKIKMRSAFATTVQYSINVYQFNIKRESI